MFVAVLGGHLLTLLAEILLESWVDNQFLSDRVASKLSQLDWPSVNVKEQCTYLPDELVLPSDLGVVVLCVDNVLLVLIDLAVIILDGVGVESHPEGGRGKSFGESFLLGTRERSESEGSRGSGSESSCGSGKVHGGRK